MPSNLPHRPAFTLVELLVVITIIGMLMALLMPAVNAAREAMNRSSCENNQAQLAKAVLEYETANKHYPGYANAGDQSWAEVLLPNLGRNDMASSGTRTYLPTMVCPSDKAPDATGTPTSYVVNCGLADSGSFDYKANGVFHDHTNATVVKIDSGYIQAGDGTATTLMLSENVQAWEWPRSTWGSASDGERKAGFVWRNIDPTGVIPEIYFINGQVELIGDQGVDI
ncbi:MAG: DUF1559 domain-containing protein, partial [Pirellulales bacterium]|nr:DUF1559 domain-containing protein [Pirellulales bacterium]